MPTIKFYFQAKQISTMSVTPQTAAADGTLSAGSTTDYHTAGIFAELNLEFDRGLFEVSPSDGTIENFQFGKITFSGTLSALDTNGKVSANLDAYVGYDYVKIVAQGTQTGTGGTAQKTLTLYCAIERVSTNYTGAPTALSLRPCGLLPTWA